MRFLLLDDATADLVRGTAADGSFLAPRRVDYGPHAGKHILPPRVLDDPDHSEWWDVLKVCPEGEIDIEADFAPAEE